MTFSVVSCSGNLFEENCFCFFQLHLRTSSLKGHVRTEPSYTKTCFYTPTIPTYTYTYTYAYSYVRRTEYAISISNRNRELLKQFVLVRVFTRYSHNFFHLFFFVRAFVFVCVLVHTHSSAASIKLKERNKTFAKYDC